MLILGGRYRPRDEDDYNVFSVETILIIPSFKIGKPIIFIIDTGASQTTINVKDAIVLGIDYRKLKSSPTNVVGIGGSVKTYELPKASLIFNVDNNRQYEEELDSGLVLKKNERIKNPRKLTSILRQPSLLGMDILKKYRIRFNNFTAILEI